MKGGFPDELDYRTEGFLARLVVFSVPRWLGFSERQFWIVRCQEADSRQMRPRVRISGAFCRLGEIFDGEDADEDHYNGVAGAVPEGVLREQTVPRGDGFVRSRPPRILPLKGSPPIGLSASPPLSMYD